MAEIGNRGFISTIKRPLLKWGKIDVILSIKKKIVETEIKRDERKINPIEPTDLIDLPIYTQL